MGIAEPLPESGAWQQPDSESITDVSVQAHAVVCRQVKSSGRGTKHWTPASLLVAESDEHCCAAVVD
jgi:hypothetical protein